MRLPHAMLFLTAIGTLSSCGHEGSIYIQHKQAGRDVVLRIIETYNRPPRYAMLVCVGGPTEDIEKLGYKTTSTVQSTEVCIGDKPAMTALWGKKVLWRWGDAAPLQSAPLSEQDMKLLSDNTWPTLPASEIIRQSFGDVGSPATAPASAPK